MGSRWGELRAEIEQVLFQRAGLLDSLLPPVLFLLLFTLGGFNLAAAGSLILASLIGGYRLWRRQPLWYALGGVLGVVLAILLARWSGGAAGFFLPGAASSLLTFVLCAASLLAKRPLVAWTSHIARRWPLTWYWHPHIRPAYSEVTLAWTLYFGARFAIQFGLIQRAEAGALAITNLLLGWPATLVLLVLSYLYGRWRLEKLEGPSVEEHLQGAGPPWEGQRQGF